MLNKAYQGGNTVPCSVSQVGSGSVSWLFAAHVPR